VGKRRRQEVGIQHSHVLHVFFSTAPTAVSLPVGIWARIDKEK